MGRQDRIAEEKLRAVARYAESALFTEAEMVAVGYSDEKCATPVNVPTSVYPELERHFDSRQIVELTAAIAVENLRARFNRALDIGSDGLCMLPRFAAAPDKAAATRI